ncbi:hypothetical protein [Bacillus sp. ISL-77]|uniref:hypothetical protein n=1 Tax=Bacillus sp. ISL-77 TaxID=2819138 RepID=UPI001BE54021|nr:hypothetical protein [Bacillus sp. ISL-77]MBT2739992.1 hypothetical protein [Bacillus sp. ISL-77]
MNRYNVQIIDGAINSVFEIYNINEEQFNIIFPNGTDVAFTSDFPYLEDHEDFWSLFYSRRVDKKKVEGIHGTIHLKGSDAVKEDFPNRKETDAGMF